MWNKALGKKLQALQLQFMKTPTTTGKVRRSFRIPTFLIWTEQNASSKFYREFREQVEVWNEKRSFFAEAFIESLIHSDLCVMCGKYGKYKKATRLCSRCINTDKGREYVKQQAVDSVRKRWKEDYDTLLEKQKQISREKYGTDFPWQNTKHNKLFQKKRKERCLAKYGFVHPLMNSEIYKKQATASFRLKEVTVQDKLFLCQGYEPIILPKLVRKFGVTNVISQFDKRFIPIEDENLFFAPDFYITTNDTYVEVKSDYTLMLDFKKNQAKAKLAELMGKRVAWFVIFKDKKMIRLPKDWHTLPKRKLILLTKSG